MWSARIGRLKPGRLSIWTGFSEELPFPPEAATILNNKEM